MITIDTSVIAASFFTDEQWHEAADRFIPDVEREKQKHECSECFCFRAEERNIGIIPRRFASNKGE